MLGAGQESPQGGGKLNEKVFILFIYFFFGGGFYKSWRNLTGLLLGC